MKSMMNTNLQLFFRVAVVIVVVIVFTQLYFMKIHSKNSSSGKFLAKKTEKLKVILFYTPCFGEPNYTTTGINTKTLMFEYPNGQPCEHKCRLTHNKNELHTSDAVTFHSRDIPENIHELSRSRRNYKQRWIFYTHENAYNLGRDPATMKGIFNWTDSYQTFSDIFHPYHEYRQLRYDEIPNVPQNINYAERKTNLVTWSVGNCNSNSLREQIVKKLTQFVPTVINGRCADSFPKRKNVSSCGQFGNPRCTRLYNSTKFYLSFENGICEDYITEKYWNTPLRNDMVPIVYGPQTYYRKLAIPGSYINLFDFPSIEALANYLKYLDKNDTAYNEYFTWKTKYKTHNTMFACRLCNKLHNETLPSKTYNDFSAYGRSACDKNLDKVRKYL